MNTALMSATTEDEAFLSELFKDVRSAEFVPLGLPEPMLAQLLDMQFRAQKNGYTAQFPQAIDRILWSGTTRIGRLLLNESESEIRLVDIAILAPYRGQGLGGHLLQELCVRAKAEGIPLRLSVRFGNPAERLYQRLGFVRTGGDGVYVAMELSEQGTVADPIKSGPPLAIETNAIVEQGYTQAYFRTLIGRKVKARGQNGMEVELSVEDVKSLPAPKSGPVLDTGDSFTVHLRGPASPVLPDACADLSPEVAQAMSVFLVPIGQDAQGIKYEAVFNRMTPRT